jgi:hypothetical protein
MPGPQSANLSAAALGQPGGDATIGPNADRKRLVQHFSK